jgi:hypothetical protein
MAIAAEPTPEPVLANSFNTVIWSADGTSGDIDINSVGFQPDFVWAKVRTQPYSHTLFDSVRGVGSTHMLFSDSTNSESTNTANSSGNGFVSSFNTDGFTGATGTSANSYFNLTGNDYVAWCWKAGGLPAINNEGSIDSIVSANPAAGFSVVSTQSDGSGYLNFGHGLSQAPELVITKFTSQTGEWYTYTSAISNGFDVALKLNSADGAITAYGADKWSSTDSVVGVGNPQWYFTANVPFITYCFHSVDGYQKVGSYNGGSSGSSNVITIGFKPSFLIVKRTDQAGDAWQMFDSTMAGADTFDSYLQANTAAAEASYNLREVNFTNTGFYWTYAESGTNISGGTYIYLAIK